MVNIFTMATKKNLALARPKSDKVQIRQNDPLATDIFCQGTFVPNNNFVRIIEVFSVAIETMFTIVTE